MSYIGEIQYLTIGDSTYSLPSSGGSGTVTSIGVSNATNGTWTQFSKVYRKINGEWVDQIDIDSVLSTDTSYRKL